MAGSNERDTSWIRRFHASEQAAVTLLCFPYAGGSASFYFPVSRALAPSVEVLAVQYPGRQDRRAEARVEDIGELADRTVRALDGWITRPVALFGHSLGATLAYEVALRLGRRGTPPIALFASGRRAPSRYRDERLHQLDDAGLLAELRTLSGTTSSLLDDDEVMRTVLPALRSDYKAIETYRHRPGETLACPLSVLIGDDDPKVDLAEAEAWREHSSGPFELRVHPGGHFYLNERAAEVIGYLRERLAALAGTAPAR
ncbi:thioesterase II family protein [Allonocardiopsis opalescens]|uniref:Surfactin synthase thioesterase subunit n=1 Tax=Allonocardiopsis opalescens TaxID=1144618 RepID=A0A2T0QCT5_9ACTN|nr:alpha/beta fold hydrolase [Allonocardiopsis opalescens]PRY01764.1 surfactin synthase thioesterase subunit [Allonocardiopsis opalescens]